MDVMVAIKGGCSGGTDQLIPTHLRTKRSALKVVRPSIGRGARLVRPLLSEHDTCPIFV